MNPTRREKVIWIAILGIFLGAAAVATCQGPGGAPPSPGEVSRGNAPAEVPPQGLVPLDVGPAKIWVEIADTTEQRQRGLMFRDTLGADRGMIFVFPEERHLSFWMKNTRIPLSIAFVRADGRISEIQDMAPFDETSHESIVQNAYALEANRGWFEKAGVKVGDRVEGLAQLPPGKE